MIGVWIPLSQGKAALVDARDHQPVLDCGKWSAHLIGGIWYLSTILLPNFGRKMIWQDEREIARQRAARKPPEAA